MKRARYDGDAIHSATGKRRSESDVGRPDSVTSPPPAVPLVERLTSGRPSADFTSTEHGPRTETSASTVVVRLPESCEDVADAVDCSAFVTEFSNSAAVEVRDFGDSSPPRLSSLLMIPTRIADGSSRILVQVLSHTFPVMLDSGAEVSVLPMRVVKSFQPRIRMPTTTREVRTFGSSNALLRGPVPLEIQLCGITVVHLFYFVDANVPALVGYDLMRAARLVVDVDNRLVWSRRLHLSAFAGPNPAESVQNPSVQAAVSFFEGPDDFEESQGDEVRSVEFSDHSVDVVQCDEVPSVPPFSQSVGESAVSEVSLCSGSSLPQLSSSVVQSSVESAASSSGEFLSTPTFSPAVEGPSVSAVSACDDVQPAQFSSQVEPVSVQSSVVSRQVSVVRSPLSYRASVLNPSAAPFHPRVNQFKDAPHSSPSLPQPLYLPVHPLVDPNDTVSHLSAPLSSVFTVPSPSSDLSVPPNLQGLFDQTVEHADLSESLQQSLAAVLRHNSRAFATGPDDLGFCNLLPHDIDTGDAIPIKQSPRRPPLSALEAEDEILDEMLRAKVIEPSMSPWSSPVCMVKKKDGTYRYCIDYRRVNAVTRKDAFPVPHVKDALDSLRGARYFATIDMLSGYWQMPMTERAKACSAFCTRRGLFQFTRMLFGLSNAPASFCRLMQIIFKDMLHKCCFVYLDDIIVFASSPEQLIERLNAVFTRLRQNGLRAKPSKCVLFKSPIEFLGYGPPMVKRAQFVDVKLFNILKLIYDILTRNLSL